MDKQEVLQTFLRALGGNGPRITAFPVACNVRSEVHDDGTHDQDDTFTYLQLLDQQSIVLPDEFGCSNYRVTVDGSKFADRLGAEEKPYPVFRKYQQRAFDGDLEPGRIWDLRYEIRSSTCLSECDGPGLYSFSKVFTPSLVATEVEVSFPQHLPVDRAVILQKEEGDPGISAFCSGSSASRAEWRIVGEAEREGNVFRYNWNTDWARRKGPEGFFSYVLSRRPVGQWLVLCALLRCDEAFLHGATMVKRGSPLESPRPTEEAAGSIHASVTS